MIKVTSYNSQPHDHLSIIGFYGEPIASGYLAKAVSFYSRLFLFPFTVKWSESQRTYNVVKFNLFQKGLFLLFVFGNSISFIFWVTTTFQQLEQLSKAGVSLTPGVLILLGLLLTWLSVTTVVLIVWIRHEEINRFLRELGDSLDVLHLPSLTVWLCPVVFYFASSITNLASATGQMTVSHGSKMMTDGIICILKRFFGSDGGYDGWLFRLIVKVMQGCFKLLIFHGGCFYSMPHTLLLSISLGLRQVGKEVKRTLESGSVSVCEGLRIYDKMKRIANAANSAFGAVILTHYMCNLTFAIQTPFLYQELGQTVEDINYLLWLIVSGLIWWTGSEFHRLVLESLKNWIQSSLSREMSLDDRLKLSILSNSIDKDNLGLYTRYFIVTHRFLTTTCGAVLTYGIIVIQLQIQPMEMCPNSDTEIT